MRILISIAFVGMLVFGVSRSVGSSAAAPGTHPADESACPAAREAVDDVQVQPEGANSYECRYSPYCQRASQCTTYCAGGIPACVQGCCACAS